MLKARIHKLGTKICVYLQLFSFKVGITHFLPDAVFYHSVQLCQDSAQKLAPQVTAMLKFCPNCELTK